MLLHNEEYGGIIYKYDLPIQNQPVKFRSQLLTTMDENLINTSVENLYSALDIDKDTSYESFTIKLH